MTIVPLIGRFLYHAMDLLIFSPSNSKRKILSRSRNCNWILTFFRSILNVWGNSALICFARCLQRSQVNILSFSKASIRCLNYFRINVLYLRAICLQVRYHSKLFFLIRRTTRHNMAILWNFVVRSGLNYSNLWYP